MRISIIIPAYNEEALIHRCLAALRNQDFQGEMEIIVVDNNSTDRTADVAERWGAWVVREERQGYVFALKRGTEEATGEILAFTDADTIVPEDWLSTLVKTFENHPETVAVGGCPDFYDPNWKGRLFNRYVLPIGLIYDRLCFSYAHLWGATMAVRKNAFLKAGGWTGKFNLHADSDLSRRLARLGKVRMIPDLSVATSARRWNQQLILNALVYGLNFLALHLLHHPIFFNFPAVRTSPSNLSLDRLPPRQRWHVLYASGILVTLLGLGVFFTAWPSASAFGKVFWHIPTHDKVIALTFDDGPNEPYTSEVLKILKENDIHATFFLIGSNVKYYPNAAREIVKEGHVIGNHSYSHPLFLVLEKSKNRDRQIDLGERAIEEVTGVHCTLFRPPHGFRTPWLLKTLDKRDLTCVEWAEDGNDWNNVTSEQIVQRVLKNVKPGNIILLHDGMNLKHGADQEKTVKALPVIIDSLKARGYRFVTVPELLSLTPLQAAK